MKLAILGITVIALAGCQSFDNSPARLLHPVEECSMVDVPVYGMVNRPASSGEVLGGAIIGGLIGNQFGKGDGKTAMTALDAIVGGSSGGERKTERVIVSYTKERRCTTVYR